MKNILNNNIKYIIIVFIGAITIFIASNILNLNGNDNISLGVDNIVEEVDVLQGYNDFKYFTLQSEKNVNLSNDIYGHFVNNKIYFFIPPGINIKKMVATFEATTTDVKVDNDMQISGVTENDFSKTVKYVINGEGGTNTYYIECIQSDIPFIEIETNEKTPIESKDKYVKATMKISAEKNLRIVSYNDEIEIRGRGNTSWGMPKKSYKIKLKEKSPILGMQAEKDWVIIANYSDKTLVRNKLAYDLSKELGIKYAQDSEFVHVSINGGYNGVYLLTEPVEVSKSRVDIETFKDSKEDSESINRGYLLEVDARGDGDVFFDSGKGARVVFKNPKVPNEKQLEYIETYIGELEYILYNDDPEIKKRYVDYIDVDSFVNWYLVNEIFKNNDSVLYTSVYLYKDVNGKLNIGPPWDFDISAGNIEINNNDNPEGWWVKSSRWFNKLLEDKMFTDKVIKRFKEIEPILDKVPNQIDYYANQLDLAQKMNFIRWDILNEKVWSNPIVTGSYEGEIEYLKKWLIFRINWMKENIDSIN